ncbi:hypothetical protein BCR41DRAFT_369129 [Lobosporangium transversale]|uniref:Uncharacterized protein n=1 Tax=Lobosporangium transversale TaxID=64571 RepID=A0A1Y2GTG3_9FUNG|nr:hypothetical protein BCR41DRAFT_369129 [Lobosporangium transversale]ORZ22799.1 hypothetical protein BCR41DRAFT_369129 [Lobosporangium transversale]|eukprot:XP_021883353.1 hypothetical protein BCR41DRAFT_369129 [Lobosporangium transversale]
MLATDSNPFSKHSITQLGYIEKNTLAQLISGDDGILQIRGNRLENYVIYPIIDVLEDATSEFQVLILMNRLDAQSSKAFVSSLKKHLNVAEVPNTFYTAQQDKMVGLGPLLSSSTTPSIYAITPEMMTQLKNEGVIVPKAVHVMIVYEAEYVLRTPAQIESIRIALDEFEVCQVILAVHDATEDVLHAAEAFGFSDKTIVFSMDHTNIYTAEHYRFTEETMLESLLDRAVQFSKENAVVVLCHDAREAQRIRGQLAERAEMASRGEEIYFSCNRSIFSNSIANVYYSVDK